MHFADAWQTHCGPVRQPVATDRASLLPANTLPSALAQAATMAAGVLRAGGAALKRRHCSKVPSEADTRATGAPARRWL